jgi:hypothetical protein
MGWTRDPRIIEGTVEAIVGFERSCDGPLDGLVVRDVGRHKDRLAAPRANGLGGCLTARIDVDERDPCTPFRKETRSGRSDPGSCPGDERDAPLELSRCLCAHSDRTLSARHALLALPFAVIASPLHAMDHSEPYQSCRKM